MKISHQFLILGSLIFLSISCGDRGSLDKSPTTPADQISGPTPASSTLTSVQNLFVSDSRNNRVLIYNVSSISAGEAAEKVLGQNSFTSSAINRDPQQSSLTQPYSLSASLLGQYLYIPDSDNGRVLVWNINNVNSMANGSPADYVLGQQNFTSSDQTTTETSLGDPQEVEVDAANNRLFVVDGRNHRIMIFDVASIDNGETASHILGSTGFTTSGVERLSASTFNTPRGIAYDSVNNRLFVSDTANHRILVFDASSITDGEGAIYVLGQSDFGSNSRGTAVHKLDDPRGLAYSAPYLYVSDFGNNRVLVFDVSSLSNGKEAAYVLGQPNFDTNFQATGASKLNGPQDVVVDETGKILFVADQRNNRILIFDIATITNGEDSVNVLGQSNFISNNSGTSSTSLNSPSGVTLKKSD